MSIMRLTKAEREEGFAALEGKYIANRTPEDFERRALALCGGDRASVLRTLNIERRTFKRWVNGTSTIPGVAWVALEALERLKESGQ